MDIIFNFFYIPFFLNIYILKFLTELTEIQLKQALTTLKLINHAIQKIPGN